MTFQAVKSVAFPGDLDEIGVARSKPLPVPVDANISLAVLVYVSLFTHFYQVWREMVCRQGLVPDLVCLCPLVFRGAADNQDRSGDQRFCRKQR